MPRALITPPTCIGGRSIVDRIPTPSGVLTKVRPCAGLIEDMEREDNARGPEPEPESVLRVIISRPVIGGTTWR
jgi:hypothetical protein